MIKKAEKSVGAEINTLPVHDRTVNGFIAENSDKWTRAIYGTVIQEGSLIGGVGEGATPEAKLAEYDRLGGLITKDGRKIKMGCFWNFKGKKAHETPEPVMEFKVDGETVDVPVGDAVPVEVQAAEIAGARKKVKRAKPTVEDEE